MNGSFGPVPVLSPRNHTITSHNVQIFQLCSGMPLMYFWHELIILTENVHMHSIFMDNIYFVYFAHCKSIVVHEIKDWVQTFLAALVKKKVM